MNTFHKHKALLDIPVQYITTFINNFLRYLLLIEDALYQLAGLEMNFSFPSPALLEHPVLPTCQWGVGKSSAPGPRRPARCEAVSDTVWQGAASSAARCIPKHHPLHSGQGELDAAPETKSSLLNK